MLEPKIQNVHASEIGNYLLRIDDGLMRFANITFTNF